MKQLRSLLAVMLLTACGTAFAQYDYGYYQSDRNAYSKSVYDYSEGWGSVYFDYSPLDLVSNEDHYYDFDKMKFNAFTIGGSYALRLGYSPTYLEAGIEVTGAYFSERYDDPEYGRTKHSYEMYWTKIPLNFVCRWDIAPEFAIIPYAGINLKINASTEERIKDDYGEEVWRHNNRDYTWDDEYKHLQVGYQGGIKLMFANTFFIGAAYQGDLTPFYSDGDFKQKFRGVSFNAGFCF